MGCGGGLGGSAGDDGLAGEGCRVGGLDEGERAVRDSRGNVGLVWVQGKGWDFPSYEKWSNSAANLWPEFNQELSESSGVDTGYTRPGGLELYLSETKWENRSQEMAQVRQHVGDQFEYEMLDHAA